VICFVFMIEISPKLRLPVSGDLCRNTLLLHMGFDDDLDAVVFGWRTNIMES
jgi:hypothetical protein